jgi:dsDNA-specific endonuclease/ATPase MutS2
LKPVVRERDIKTLEFDLIREQLAALTVTPMARERAAALLPSADYAAVERSLQETSEGRLLCARGAFSPAAAPDIEPLVGRAAKGGRLEGLTWRRSRFF